MSNMINIKKIKLLVIELSAKSGIISKKQIIEKDKLPVFEQSIIKGIANYSTSGNVYKLELFGECYYFRICHKHKELKEYIISLIDQYSSQMSSSFIEDLKEKLEERSVLNTFSKMGNIEDPSSGVYNYFLTGDCSYLGLPSTFINESNKEQFNLFVNYIWSELYSYRINSNSGNYHIFNYNRGKAQDLLYSFWGIQNLICPIKLVLLRGQKEWVGSLMSEAKGINPKELRKGEIGSLLSPTIVRDLTTLNFMDVLCYEGDHRPGNYIVVLDESGRGVSIQAFDNDSPLDFFPTTTLAKRVCNSEPFVKNGIINRAHMDKDFVNMVLSSDNGNALAILKPYLSKIQLIFFWLRLRRLKKALKKTVLKRPGFLLNREEWDDLSLEDDLSYGNTYYSILRDWYEGDKDPVLLQQGKQPLCSVVF